MISEQFGIGKSFAARPFLEARFSITSRSRARVCLIFTYVNDKFARDNNRVNDFLAFIIIRDAQSSRQSFASIIRRNLTGPGGQLPA